MYGNYTTMTNAGPAILQRIIEQRLSPQYISVHVTDYEVRKLLMGLKKDDHILDKIKLLHDNSVDMHTQIVLCPDINDGAILKKTVEDLYLYNKHIVSLAIVPVGLTDHRFGLTALRKVGRHYASLLLEQIEDWQKRFRREIGRGFVYASDEFFITAGRDLPSARQYDSFPQTENGVGLVRSFIEDFRKQSRKFPARLARKRRLVMATGVLASGFMQKEILSCLKKIIGLDVEIVVTPNTLFGESVTVAGLLSGKCLYSSLNDKDCGDMILLPNLIEPIVKPLAMSLREIDEAMIRCYRDFYMAKMGSFYAYPDEFRRRYMLSSMKLIMRSSFITEKMGKLGMPAAMQKILAAAGGGALPGSG